MMTRPHPSGRAGKRQRPAAARTLLPWALAVLGWAVCTSPAQALCVAPLCSCTVTASAMNFGPVVPLSSHPTDSTATVRVKCGGVAGLVIPYRVDLGPGNGTIPARRMNGPGASTLSYNLYTNDARTVVWGENQQGVPGLITLDLLGLSPEQLLTVYGRIPGSQTLAHPGAHGDSILVTLTYF